MSCFNLFQIVYTSNTTINSNSLIGVLRDTVITAITHDTRYRLLRIMPYSILIVTFPLWNQ